MPLPKKVTGILKRAVLAIIAIASITTAAATSADARPKHRQQAAAPVTCDQRGCSDSPTAVAARKVQRSQRGAPEASTTEAYTARAQQQVSRRTEETQVDANGNSVIIGSRPSGCPRQFCGCEASLYLFGKIIPELNLASNWRKKFPRTTPAAGMVAARSGHVFVLMSHVEGNQWLVHDGNSGGGKTRRHVRSIAGYTIVNPHASQLASN
jgi:hypothetical protein